jgi:hypothetical protein
MSMPQLNRKSLQMASKQYPVDFLERVHQTTSAVKQKHEELSLRRELVPSECTFAPHINHKSKKMTPRSLVDMSFGDALKVETKRKMLVMVDEARELHHASFHPNLNRNRGVDSVLRLKDDPHSYVQRMQEQELRKQERLMRIKLEEECKLDLECTFSPRTKDWKSPSFRNVSPRVDRPASARERSTKEQTAPAGWK